MPALSCLGLAECDSFFLHHPAINTAAAEKTQRQAFMEKEEPGDRPVYAAGNGQTQRGPLTHTLAPADPEI